MPKLSVPSEQIISIRFLLSYEINQMTYFAPKSEEEYKVYLDNLLVEYQFACFSEKQGDGTCTAVRSVRRFSLVSRFRLLSAGQLSRDYQDGSSNSRKDLQDVVR